MKLRPYQIEAIDATARAFIKHKRVLLVLPTGSGKSVVIGGLIARMRAKGMKILVLCHQSEILTQNAKAIESICGERVAFYSAKLNEKNIDANIVLASRDTLGRVTDIPHFDSIIVDESHLISRKPDSYYQKIFKAVEPKYILGLTATPFRNSGKIWGKEKFFEAVSFNLSLDFLTKEGFLTPHIFPDDKEVIIDTSDVKATAGDFNLKELEQKSNAVVDRCVDKWWKLAQDRRCSIFFCVSRAHADLVLQSIKRYTQDVGYLDGNTKSSERNDIFERAKNGEFKALVNITVLSVGTDIPVCDCAVLLRATKSPSLYVQMIGRVLRLYPDKLNSLVIDMTDSSERFGSISEPMVKEPSKKKKGDEIFFVANRERPCPTCAQVIASNCKQCGFCGEIFFKHQDEVFTGESKLEKVVFQKHELKTAKNGNPYVELNLVLENGDTVKEFLFIKSEGFFGSRARAIHWKINKGATIVGIKRDLNAKYNKIKEFKFGVQETSFKIASKDPTNEVHPSERHLPSS
jgi:DNA repair protein RadD